MNTIKTKLKKHNQTHLLKFFNQLNQSEKTHLLEQIDSIDFDQVEELMKVTKKEIKETSLKPIKSYETNDEYYKLGLNSFKQGEYALVTMAGGQGTRLGYNGPKGTYVLKYGINKSLFELQCDMLKKIYEDTKIYTPWYIMTSKSNHKDTVKFFENNNFFNYPKEKITFFVQKELPIINDDGKIIMDSKFNIKMGANGSGGVFEALDENNILKQMIDQGIKWIFIGGIDNPLLPVDNPDLVGLAIKEDFKTASKIIKKNYPEEKVGVFGYKNDKPSVIEYIEMTNEMNNLKDKEGNLVYSDSHILMNLFHISVLETIAKQKLEYRAAHKKNYYIDDNGKLISPIKENSYKFETFIFDGFSYVNNIGLLKGKREEIFAPIKNKEGLDSPETAAKLYLNKKSSLL